MTQPVWEGVKRLHSNKRTDDFPDPIVFDCFCENHRLTPRERQMMAMICRGMKNSQIGGELSVSNATIRLHIGNLHRKLNTRSKVDLVLKLWKWSCGSARPETG